MYNLYYFFLSERIWSLFKVVYNIIEIFISTYHGDRDCHVRHDDRGDCHVWHDDRGDYHVRHDDRGACHVWHDDRGDCHVRHDDRDACHVWHDDRDAFLHDACDASCGDGHLTKRKTCF